MNTTKQRPGDRDHGHTGQEHLTQHCSKPALYRAKERLRLAWQETRGREASYEAHGRFIRASLAYYGLGWRGQS